MSPTQGQDLASHLRNLIAHKDDNGAEDPGEYLTALITSAVHDETPQYTLKDIYSAVANAGAAQDLDVLHAVPSLVGSDRDGVRDLISLLSECGNAKETVIAVQESLEHMKLELQATDESDKKHRSVYGPLESILVLYTGTIPRMKLRKKTPVETLRPLIADIGPTLQFASQSLTKNEGQEIMQRMCELIASIVKWTMSLEQQSAGGDDSQSSPQGVKDLCRELLIQSLEALSPLLKFSLAQRKFEEIYPRLVMRNLNVALPNTAVLSSCLDTARILSLNQDTLLQSNSIGGLILLAYVFTRISPSAFPPTSKLLESHLPLIITSLQSSFAIDESLYILQTTLHSSSRSTLDPDILTPLIHTLVPLSSTHPSPHIRHIAFKLLGTLLSRLPHLDKMYILRDLLSDGEENFPPMRVAAVGLLKDAVTEALASKEKNPFSSPMLFEVIVGKMFRFDADESKRLEELVETSETKRLVEMLSFYYILLARDKDNRTGARDASNIKAIKSAFVSPLRSTVNRWKGIDITDHDQQFSLVALDISLQRVEEQITTLEE